MYSPKWKSRKSHCNCSYKRRQMRFQIIQPIPKLSHESSVLTPLTLVFNSLLKLSIFMKPCHATVRIETLLLSLMLFAVSKSHFYFFVPLTFAYIKGQWFKANSLFLLIFRQKKKSFKKIFFY